MTRIVWAYTTPTAAKLACRKLYLRALLAKVTTDGTTKIELLVPTSMTIEQGRNALARWLPDGTTIHLEATK